MSSPTFTATGMGIAACIISPPIAERLAAEPAQVDAQEQSRPDLCEWVAWVEVLSNSLHQTVADLEAVHSILIDPRGMF